MGLNDRKTVLFCVTGKRRTLFMQLVARALIVFACQKRIWVLCADSDFVYRRSLSVITLQFLDSSYHEGL